MTKDEALKILSEEGLKRFNWFNEQNLSEDEVGIKFENEKWVVYVTSERAAIEVPSIAVYNGEGEALDDFIDRVRTEKNIIS